MMADEYLHPLMELHSGYAILSVLPQEDPTSLAAPLSLTRLNLNKVSHSILSLCFKKLSDAFVTNRQATKSSQQNFASSNVPQIRSKSFSRSKTYYSPIIHCSLLAQEQISIPYYTHYNIPTVRQKSTLKRRIQIWAKKRL